MQWAAFNDANLAWFYSNDSVWKNTPDHIFQESHKFTENNMDESLLHMKYSTYTSQ